ncbi:MAG: hypothetical protein QXL18_05165 [Candidatus Woesearchaeota archaeon]
MKNKKKLLYGIIIIIFLLLININAKAETIEFYYKSSKTQTTSPLSVFTKNNIIFYGGKCYDNMNGFITTIGSGEYYISNRFYNPNETLLGEGNRYLRDNVSCGFVGNFTRQISSNESYFSSIVSMFPSINLTLHKINKIICENTTKIILESSSYNNYSNGFYMFWGITGNCPSEEPIINYVLNAYNDYCYPLYEQKIPTNGIVSLGSGGGCKNLGFFYPFNSGSGIVNISIYDYYVNNNQFKYYLIKQSDGETIILDLNQQNINKTYQITLEKNTNYFFVKSIMFYSFPYYGGNYSAPNITIHIDTIFPEWLCGEWGECINGIKSRVCIDKKGIYPNTTEFESCYVYPKERIVLGFEDSYTDYVFYPRTYIGTTYPFCIGCCCGSDVKPVELPKDWYMTSNQKVKDLYTGKVGYQFDVLKITTETSYEGTKSLKMWDLPPQTDIITTYNCSLNMETNITECEYTYCENMTSVYIPELGRMFNETLFLQKNITLPSQYMSISLKAKKCQYPEYKKPAFLLCNAQTCYTSSESCSENVSGIVSVILKETDTSKTILSVSSDVNSAYNWEIKEYQIDSLNPNTTYTLYLGIVPKYGYADSNYYCVYIDDLSIDIRDTKISCVSECDGLTRYERTCKQYNQKGECILCEQVIIENSYLCANENVKDKIINCQSYCGCDYIKNTTDENYYTYYSAKLIDDCQGTTEECCKWETIKNSDYCIDYCSRKKKEEGIYTPILEAEELGLPPFLTPFFTPLFFILIISLSLTLIISSKISEKTGTFSWQITLIILLSFLSVFSILGLFPIWLLIILIIIAGFLFIRFSTDVFR